MNASKYKPQYFLPPEPCLDWARKDHIDKAPIWCSVDLRDGNQALVTPMDLEEKLEFFQFLLTLGFKEIEVGFPAASETEYEFVRTLIEQDLIPEDVSIQVLTQAREHIIRKTFEAVAGARRAIVHLYNSTSLSQRRQVFGMSQEQVRQIAVSGATLIRDLARETQGNFLFEYSPESFTGTELPYALEICNAVTEVFAPTRERPLIMNLPVTVEYSMPHVYGSQIEYMHRHLENRENLILSVHPHNDRGCAVADAEVALLAGAERVEGTLFGNGERTGNVDLVTLALNLLTQGVDPGLNLSDLPAAVKIYEKCTGMKVDKRSPYGGQLVFAAFSGSHQDAIAKGMNYRRHHPGEPWTVPYLPIDPHDIGRSYDGDIIRINSQSGKGGVGYILESRYGLYLPPKLREAMGYEAKSVSDHKHRELSPQEVFDLFKETFECLTDPYCIHEAHFLQQKDGKILAQLRCSFEGEMKVVQAIGNGRLDAVSNALKQTYGLTYSLETYTEHALEKSSRARAIAYVGIRSGEGELAWGAAVDEDIVRASLDALVTAINNEFQHKLGRK